MRCLATLLLISGLALAAGPRAVGLANAGVLLVSGDRKVLVDFPFSGSFSWCVSPGEDQVRALLQARSPFERVDAFLFTHDHVDHFDPVLVVQALKAHPRAALVGTSLVLKRVRAAGGGALPNPMHEARADVAIVHEALRVLPLQAPHATYWDIDPASGRQVIKDDGYVHMAYHVDMGGTRFLHGGDAYDIRIPPELRANLVLSSRGIYAKRGLGALLARHRALGADRTVLIHAGPSELASLRQAVQPEASWLSAFTERGQEVAVPEPGRTLMGQALPGTTPELFQPGRVSTAAHDFVVRFSPGLDELYLMRSSLDYHTGILRHVLKDGAGPELLDVPFKGSISYPCLSPDGTRMVFTGAEAGAPDLWITSRDGKGWGPAASLGPSVNSPAVEMHASMAANGNLYFCSNRPGGLGNFDIYRCVKTSDGYAPAENLGPAINTAEFEAHPWIAPDESYLLFDARRGNGRGSNDLYVSFRQPDGTWTRALELGPDINTAAGEMRPYVPPGGRVLFFCSDRAGGDPGLKPASLEAFQCRVEGPGNGSQDIWWVALEVVERLRGKALGQPVR